MRFLTLTSVLALCSAPAMADPVFTRIASFATPMNMAEGEDRARETSAEIITASDDGMTLIYSDSPLGVIGLIDITDPRAPKPLGNVDVGGEPTTAQVIGGQVFVGVNTSESYTAPSGKLVTVDLASKSVVAECDLGGQPDSVARAKDGSFLAVAIENERDEDVNDGALPQMPAGFVVKLPVKDGAVDCAGLQKIEVTGLADVAGDDPEPEFVAVNDAGEIAVTLQENNHIVIIGADGAVAGHFSAGSVDLAGIDTKKDGVPDFTGKKDGALREPDAVKWLGNDRLIVANEGDWEGGARGFTVFNRDGSVAYENGAEMERAIAAIGHYPDHRNKKGVEPEGLETGTFGETPMAFVAAERASIVAAYDMTDPAAPKLAQLIPSGVSPEGVVAIPSRNLLVTANELDLVEDGGVRAHVMIYELAEGVANYPTLVADEAALGWAALSGLAADPATPGLMYGVSDSVHAGAPTIYTIDATQTPARITGKLVVTRGGHPAQKLDLEGIAADGEGGFWLASEGRSDKLFPHAIYHVDAEGAIVKEIALPPELLAHEKRFGAEGIAVQGKTLWIAMQREWGDDPKGMVKLVAYDTDAETWGAVHYPLEAPAEGRWMGLSEITIVGDWAYIIERDNGTGSDAAVKHLTRVALADLKPAELGGNLPVVKKELVRDLIPDLNRWNGYTAEKVEGFAIDAAGQAFVVTDNDGTNDSSGETLFFGLGALN